MTSNFPATFDTLTNPVSTDPLSSATVPHASQHTNVNDIVEALEQKLGLGASTPGISPAVLRRTAASASAWDAIQPEDLALAAQVAVAAQNPIINGGMEIWQRGTSWTNVGSTTTFYADRYIVGLNDTAGTARFTVSAVADAPTLSATVTATPQGCLSIQATTPDTTPVNGDVYYIRQSIEGYRWIPYVAKQFTIGFWVKATQIGTYCFAVRNPAVGNYYYIAEYQIAVANIWEYKTVTVPACPGVTSYSNGAGISLDWVIGQPGQIGVPGSWQAGGYIATANQVNGMGTVNNVFRLWGVSMGLGPTVAPYLGRPHGEELALCQRYYERLQGVGTSTPMGLGQAYSTTDVAMSWPFKVTKRAVPTVFGSGSFAFSNAITMHALGANFTAAMFTSPESAVVRFTTSSGLVAGNAVVVNLDSIAAPYLEASADI